MNGVDEILICFFLARFWVGLDECDETDKTLGSRRSTVLHFIGQGGKMPFLDPNDAVCFAFISSDRVLA